MQVVDVEYSESQMLIATVDKSFEPNVKIGMKLKTKSNYEFVLNFSEKFPDLVVPPEAKAIYANCGDLIPVAKEIQPINVGKDYKEKTESFNIIKLEKEQDELKISSLEKEIKEKWSSLLNNWHNKPEQVIMPEGESIEDVSERSIEIDRV